MGLLIYKATHDAHYGVFVNAFTPNYLLSAGVDDNLKLFDAASSWLLKVFKEHNAEVIAANVSTSK